MQTNPDEIHLTAIEPGDPMPEGFELDEAVRFLSEHLDEFGDTEEAIRSAIDYALSRPEGPGGFLLLASNADSPVGIAVVNRTGMTGYIPANILVYIAVDPTRRGAGIGRRMVEHLQQICSGGIALHVEYDNPARRMYERLGFTSKYAEMRYEKVK
jgi:GNAT superfamily N-acetyltransferase